MDSKQAWIMSALLYVTMMKEKIDASHLVDETSFLDSLLVLQVAAKGGFTMAEAHAERVAEQVPSDARRIDGAQKCGVEPCESSLLLESKGFGDLGICLLQSSDATTDLELATQILLFVHVVEMIGDGFPVECEASPVLMQLVGEDGVFKCAEGQLSIKEVFVEASGSENGASQDSEVSGVDVLETQMGGVFHVVEGKLGAARIYVVNEAGDGNLFMPEEKALRAGIAGIEHLPVVLQHSLTRKNVVVHEEDAIELRGGDSGVTSLRGTAVGNGDDSQNGGGKLGEVVEHGGGRVGGAVVDDDDLAVTNAIQREQMREGPLEDGSSIMSWNYEAEHKGFRLQWPT